MNKNSIKWVDFIYENCDVIRVKGDSIAHLYIPEITLSLSKDDYKIYSCKYLSVDVTKTKSMKDEDYKEIKTRKDLVRLNIHYKNKESYDVNVPEPKRFFAWWANPYQINEEEIYETERRVSIVVQPHFSIHLVSSYIKDKYYQFRCRNGRYLFVYALKRQIKNFFRCR